MFLTGLTLADAAPIFKGFEILFREDVARSAGVVHSTLTR